MKPLNTKPILVLTAVLLGMFAVGAQAEQKPPAVDKDGLHLVPDAKAGTVYMRPEVDLSQFDKVILVEPYVAFRKNWKRDQNEADPFKVSSGQVEKIKQRVGDEFVKVFAEELEKQGHPVVDKSKTGPGVLIVRPAIVNLDVEAPDTRRGRSTSVSASAVAMTLYAELYDSVSNQIIGRVVDPQVDRTAQFMVKTEGTNKLAEDRIVKGWADALAKQLHDTVE